MILLAHLMRNNSQVGLNAFQANGEIVVNVCMYKHDTCIVHDVLIMSNSCPALPNPSKNPQVHLPRENLCDRRSRGRPACA